jgi:hypothetical protein
MDSQGICFLLESGLSGERTEQPGHDSRPPSERSSILLYHLPQNVCGEERNAILPSACPTRSLCFRRHVTSLWLPIRDYRRGFRSG